jgi:hypothetical protein
MGGEVGTNHNAVGSKRIAGGNRFTSSDFQVIDSPAMKSGLKVAFTEFGCRPGLTLGNALG